jgi:hypothetical protein
VGGPGPILTHRERRQRLAACAGTDDRYQESAALAEDLGKYSHGQPVKAGPDCFVLDERDWATTWPEWVNMIDALVCAATVRCFSAMWAAGIEHASVF